MSPTRERSSQLQIKKVTQQSKFLPHSWSLYSSKTKPVFFVLVCPVSISNWRRNSWTCLKSTKCPTAVEDKPKSLEELYYRLENENYSATNRNKLLWYIKTGKLIRFRTISTVRHQRQGPKVSWHNSSQNPLGHPPAAAITHHFVAGDLLSDVLPPGGAGQASYELLSCQMYLCRGTDPHSCFQHRAAWWLREGHPAQPSCLPGQGALSLPEGLGTVAWAAQAQQLKAQNEIGWGLSSANAFPNQPQLMLCKNFAACPTLTSSPCVVCVTQSQVQHCCSP